MLSVQLAKTFPSGVTTISEELRRGIDLLFEQLSDTFHDCLQYFTFLIDRIPPSPGLPLYLNESDETQDAFATYNWYAQLKQVYSKYDPTRYVRRYRVLPSSIR